jgi:hypothetical protein
MSSSTGSAKMQLINEALSRARMLLPQTVRSEAIRPARSIAMKARHTQARELGHL